MGSLTELVHGEEPLLPLQALPVVDRANVVVGEGHGIPKGDNNKGYCRQPPTSLHPHSWLALD